MSFHTVWTKAITLQKKIETYEDFQNYVNDDQLIEPYVNAGEKLHRWAGVKLHHGWMPDGLLREASFCLLAVDVG